MLETIAIVLIILWILGFVSAYTLGGFIHILLVIALVAIVIRIIQGRRPF
ncbi:MAG: lmo0937 family membrane protein [Nitrosomonas sp.]|nr:lmo0937 family membrane protein [Nitrosomonas sp.]MCG7757445.1 lmo0937 family membrane protein [Nitrosomonas sp.]UJP01261.1 MAG: lmo0937 family membrane protein [Nitrosomonas sp.]UJP07229.1 MAG: lmo0937 family membrane protein [Nitrosomonas sp.]